MNSEKSISCVVCKQTQKEVPIINISYKNENLGICPKHMPVLIHNPSELEGIIDGAENF